MAIPGHSRVMLHDVFALTKLGEAELKGARTALEPAALELLVRMDGKTPVSGIAAGMRTTPQDEVIARIMKLHGAGLIDYASKTQDDVLDFDWPLATDPLSPDAINGATQEAGAGVSSLAQDGYYVRIMRTPAERPMLPLDRRAVVVIVEDDPHVAAFLKHLVRLENFDARTAVNREEIIQAFRQPPRPDLVLLDVMLPDADGFDVLAKIRQHPALASVPVVMLTAKTTREAVIKGLAGGANGYITKPFEPDVLLKALRTLFGDYLGPKGGARKPG